MIHRPRFACKPRSVNYPQIA